MEAFGLRTRIYFALKRWIVIDMNSGIPFITYWLKEAKRASL